MSESSRRAKRWTPQATGIKRATAARQLLRLLGQLENAEVERRPGDVEPGLLDLVVAACEGPLAHTPYGFTFTETLFPIFSSVLRPHAPNVRQLDKFEAALDETHDAYAGNPRKFVRGVIFDTGDHLYLYTDWPLDEIAGLDLLRFSDHGRLRFVVSLPAFVQVHFYQHT